MHVITNQGGRGAYYVRNSYQFICNWNNCPAKIVGWNRKQPFRLDKIINIYGFIVWRSIASDTRFADQTNISTSLDRNICYCSEEKETNEDIPPEECINILSFKSFQFKENGKWDVCHRKNSYLRYFLSISNVYNNLNSRSYWRSNIKQILTLS